MQSLIHVLYIEPYSVIFRRFYLKVTIWIDGWKTRNAWIVQISLILNFLRNWGIRGSLLGLFPFFPGLRRVLGLWYPRVVRSLNRQKFLVQNCSSIHIDWAHHRCFLVAVYVLKLFLEHLSLFNRRLQCCLIHKIIFIFRRVFRIFFNGGYFLKSVKNLFTFWVLMGVRSLYVYQELWLLQISISVSYFERACTKL